MERIEEIHGVKIPERLQEDRDQALLYAAGFIYALERREGDPPIPDEINGLLERYGSPMLYDNVRNPDLAEYVGGFVVGGGNLGSRPLEPKRRISTRREDNRGK